MERKQPKCIICSRIVEESSKVPLCNIHIRAYNKLALKYGDWKNAYGDLSPREFLEKILENEYSGKWVKEVVRIILSQKELMQTFLGDLSSRDMKG
ncbi:MAG: hypothetical protein QXS51_00670 [Thermoproteota archaeon]|nr:hypothetical protein [Candidatus Brockarchaeota archaeon]